MAKQYKQILGGESVTISGGEPMLFEPSPTSTVFSISDVVELITHGF